MNGPRPTITRRRAVIIVDFYARLSSDSRSDFTLALSRVVHDGVPRSMWVETIDGKTTTQLRITGISEQRTRRAVVMIERLLTKHFSSMPARVSLLKNTSVPGDHTLHH